MKIQFNDIEAHKSEFSSKKYAAFVVEPVQGEGGMVVANEEFLQAAEEVCAVIQTGSGRTGHLFANDPYNVAPDMMLLSNTLGRGMYPIGAVVAKASAYSKHVDKKDSSTFAGAGLEVAVALKTLELLTKSEYDSSFLGSTTIDNVQGASHYIKLALNDLTKRYPGIIASRGTGLMWSLTFEDPEDQAVGNIVSTIVTKTTLSYLICGFLMNKRQILVMPFLGDENSVRFEPPLTIRPRGIMNS